MNFSSRLLKWYDANRRDLPWRTYPDPYHIWLSEIMLQQTQMSTALPYFHRFLDRAPTIKALSELTEDELLKLWEGLGYYRRAKNLHLASKRIMSDYGGELPRTYDELRELPGIGEYSAGAIASTAFGIKALAVDGNVERVMARFFLITDDVTKAATKRAIKEILWPLAPEERIGDFNQALMELGALVCLPSGMPRCEECPLKEDCLARQEEMQLDLPVKSKKKESTVLPLTVLLLRSGDSIAITKREEKGLLASLWQFPSLEGHVDPSELFGVKAEIITAQKHIFSHRVWDMLLYRVELDYHLEDYLWVPLWELHHYPMGRAFGQFKEFLDIKRDLD